MTIVKKIVYGSLLGLLSPLSHASALETATATQHSFLTQTIATVTKTNTRLALFSATYLATTAGAAWLAHHYLKSKTPPSAPPGTMSISSAPTPTSVATSSATVAVTSAQHIASIEPSLKNMNSTSPFTVAQCMLLEKLYQAYGDRAIDLLWYAVTKTVDPASQEALDRVFNQPTIQAMLDGYYNTPGSLPKELINTYQQQAREAGFVNPLHNFLIEHNNLADKVLKNDDFVDLVSRVFVRDILQETAERLQLKIQFPKKAVYFQPQLICAVRALLLIDKINLSDAPSWQQAPEDLKQQLDTLSKHADIRLDLGSDNFTLHGDRLIGIDTQNFVPFIVRCPPAPPVVMTWYKAWKEYNGKNLKLDDPVFLDRINDIFKKHHPDF